MEQKDRVREFFGRHAGAYHGGPAQSQAPDLELLIRWLAPAGTEMLLDVATATGNTALALAPLVAAVTGVDLTPEMGREFRTRAEQQGAANACFVEGDAEHLPFAAATFDLVTCRRAAHHFPNLPGVLAEMVRVLRPGGRLGIADMAAPADPAAAILLNQMETARDPSHCRALSPDEWQAVLAAAGLRVEQAAVAEEDMAFARWLAPVAADGPEAAQAAALALAAPEQVAAQVVRRQADGTLVCLKQRVVLLAVKP